MRFFTSISIAALCFVASIQAAPQGALGGTGGAGQQPAGQDPGTPAANSPAVIWDTGVGIAKGVAESGLQAISSV
ncbi:hypothetical protein LRAMOSA01124 [Lichtheimia ramosa]|uniref:Uncharacterized protein n=1 Tax=Lichtheimia ramosa TaxID=688394 RepID=A0A077WC11_9FUNG|nr:hypothetical protein LRAMOSA01124 [Lichtheimia ramosa]